MKFKNLYLGIIASAFLFASCTDNDNADNDVSLGAYDNGVFILNEGNFFSANASLSYVSNDLATFQNGCRQIHRMRTTLPIEIEISGKPDIRQIGKSVNCRN